MKFQLTHLFLMQCYNANCWLLLQTKFRRLHFSNLDLVQFPFVSSVGQQKLIRTGQVVLFIAMFIFKTLLLLNHLLLYQVSCEDEDSLGGGGSGMELDQLPCDLATCIAPMPEERIELLSSPSNIEGLPPSDCLLDCSNQVSCLIHMQVYVSMNADSFLVCINNFAVQTFIYRAQVRKRLHKVCPTILFVVAHHLAFNSLWFKHNTQHTSIGSIDQAAAIRKHEISNRPLFCNFLSRINAMATLMVLMYRPKILC